jgi:hypothetical protein
MTQSKQSREEEELAIAIERLKNEQAFARIRDHLIHGYHPRRSDLLRLWQFATGEVISDGRRCSVCHGDGASESQNEVPEYRQCSSCGGLGWDVLPTAWQRYSDE